MSRKTKRNPRREPPAAPVRTRDPYWALKILAKEVGIACLVYLAVYYGTGDRNWANAFAAAFACFLIASGIKLYRRWLIEKSP
ncbi:hypothetical protein BH10PSE17_BH10PSE17_32680 [soil metagenome]